MCIASAIFTIWSWTRPYAWRPDPEARATIVAASLQRDHSYFWLDLRLKIRPGMDHDLEQPIFLETEKTARLELADTTLAGTADKPIEEIFLRFWIEKGDLAGPINLHINHGTLSVRAGQGEPKLGDDGRKHFQTKHW